MAVLSTLKYVSDWLFQHTNIKHPKYRGHLHPLIATTTTVFVYLLVTQVLNNHFQRGESFRIREDIRLIVASAILLYLAFMFIVRYGTNGSHVIYEMMWGCNVALMSSAYALFKDRPGILAASLAMISTDQLLWYVDLLGFAFTKKFPIGVAKYLTWPTTTKARMLTSFHHVWFIPLGIAMLWKQPALPEHSWLSSCGMSLTLSILSRLFVPHSIDTGHELVYFNMNLSRELWRDVKIKILTALDGSPWYLGIPFGNTMWNAADFIAFSLLQIIFKMMK